MAEEQFVRYVKRCPEKSKYIHGKVRITCETLLELIGEGWMVEYGSDKHYSRPRVDMVDGNVFEVYLRKPKEPTDFLLGG